MMGPFPHKTVTWNDLLYKYNAHFGTTLSVINWQHIQMMAPYNNALKKRPIIMRCVTGVRYSSQPARTTYGYMISND